MLAVRGATQAAFAACYPEWTMSWTSWMSGVALLGLLAACGGPGELGDPCNDADDCVSGICVEVNGDSECSELCDTPSDCTLPGRSCCDLTLGLGPEVLACVPSAFEAAWPDDEDPICE